MAQNGGNPFKIFRHEPARLKQRCVPLSLCASESQSRRSINATHMASHALQSQASLSPTIDAVDESSHMTIPKHYLLSTMADKEKSPSPSDPSVSAPAVDANGGDEKMAQPTSAHVPIHDETATQATSATSATSAASGTDNDESSEKMPTAAQTAEGPPSSSSSAPAAADATPPTSQNPVTMLFDPLAVATTSETPQQPQDAAAEGATSSDDAQPPPQQQQEKDEVQQDVPQAPNGPTRGGILSPLAGLFGGAAAATDAPREEGAATDVERGDLGAAADAAETASDTVCSATTDGDQQSDDDDDDEDSAAKATPPSSPSNRSATVLAKGSFAATDPCRSFGDDDNDDEEWMDDDPQVFLAPKRGRRRRQIPPPRHCRPVPAVVGTSDICCTASPSWASWLFLWVLGLSLGGTFFLPRLRRRWKVVLVLETWKQASHSPSQKQSQPMSPSLMRMQPMHQTVI